MDDALVVLGSVAVGEGFNGVTHCKAPLATNVRWSPIGSNSMKVEGPFSASGNVRPGGSTNAPLN
jgi:hypothetical protein